LGRTLVTIGSHLHGLRHAHLAVATLDALADVMPLGFIEVNKRNPEVEGQRVSLVQFQQLAFAFIQAYPPRGHFSLEAVG
jgi:hypothetical protein